VFRKKGTLAISQINEYVTALSSATIDPRLCVKTNVTKASHPWSNIKPNGDDDCVFRACFPSQLSNIYISGVYIICKIQDTA
jgi:hypothetical protein